MRHVALAAAFGLALLVPIRSEAANSQTAREKGAKKACAAGDFRRGVEILAELYVDTDNVTYIFNQGRCYEQNHQWVSAIDRFREYLRKSHTATAAEKTDAEKHIADCESFRAQEEGKLAPPPVTPPLPASVVTPPSPPPATEPEVVEVERPVLPAKSQGSGLRVAGIVIGSVGVAAGLTGLLLNLKANGLADDFNRTGDPATKSTQSSYKTGSMVCYAAGAGVLVTGVVLYLIGRSGNSGKQPQVSFSPVLAPSEFSLSVRRAF